MSDAAPQSTRARVWRAFRRQGRGRFGLALVGFLALIGLTADFIASDKPYYLELDGEAYFPLAIDLGVRLGVREWPAPLLNQRFSRLAARASRAVWAPIPYDGSAPDLTGEVYEPPSRRHWLGTDGLGRDVAAGMIHGVRISLSIGLVVVAIQATVGILLGGLAGYYGGAIDLLLSRLFELMLGIPTFFLIITVAAVFPASIFILMAILGLTGWVGIARFIRAEFLHVRAMEFVEAAQSLGLTDRRVMLRHILPNAIAPVLVAMSFGVAGAVLTESGLSYLGIGVPAHLVTWGSILSIAQQHHGAWWLAVFPGAAIFATVLAYNLIGDSLRDALDPREQSG